MANGEFGIAANRKLKESEFIDTYDYDEMDVSSADSLFSGAMKKILDYVIKSPEKYPITNVTPSVDHNVLFKFLLNDSGNW